MELKQSDYPDLPFDAVRTLAAALSDERRIYGGGDTPASVAAACLRRYADCLDAYGWKPGAHRTAGWAALLIGRAPGALQLLADRHAQSMREAAQELGCD